MTKLLKKYKALCEEMVKDPKFEAEDLIGDGKLESKCNFSVQHICGEMGYDGFKAKTANMVYSLLEVDPDWQRAPAEVCIAKIEKCSAIGIAASEGARHGHVAMLVLGDLGSSGKWHTTKVPLVAHIGKKGTNGIKHANYAFSSEPAYFYREMNGKKEE